MSEPDNTIAGTSIAVVGMAGRFPGARNLSEFWRNLRDGVESISALNDAQLIAAGATPAELGKPRLRQVRRHPGRYRSLRRVILRA